MRWLLLIILLISTSLKVQEVTAQTEEISGFSLEDSKQDTLQPKSRKSPVTAFVLSLVGGATFLPGLGQHYNGEHNKGFRMGAVWFTGWIIAAGTLDSDNEKTGQAIGFPLVFAAFIWSCIDAPVSANRINKSLQQQNNYGHMLEFYKKQYFLGIDFNVCEKTIGPKLTVHF